MGNILLTCDYCYKTFKRSISNHNQRIKKGSSHTFCSNNCAICFRQPKNKYCKNCGKLLILWQEKFCSRSCSATYNNLHKKSGTRVSKLEIYLQKVLPPLYPNLKFLFNDKTAIGSELDIFIPELNLAFELNGVFHYEPIFGKEKLNKIKNNDNNKFYSCQQKSISLCIIDTTQQKNFKKSTSKKFIKIISEIIDSNLNPEEDLNF